MNIRFSLAAFMAVAMCASIGHAEVVTDVFGSGGDIELKRNGASVNDGLLRIKNQSGEQGAAFGEGNDRVNLLKFDLSSLVQPITAAGLRVQLPRGSAATPPTPNNTFDAGETLYLYGIPDLGADENFNEATVTFANLPYLTGNFSVTNPRPGTDTTANSVNDSLVTLLGTHTFTATSNFNELVTFATPALASFLQADTNDIATFILTVSQSNPTKVPVFTSDTGTEGTPPTPPTLRTNTDVINTNFDGANGTNLVDFDILRANYLKTSMTNSMGDANFDSIVNHVDFFLWRTAFLGGGGSLTDFSFDAVPEPAALLLMACTAFGAFGFSRPSRQFRK